MKYNRDIEEHKINQAKTRTIHYVLDNIDRQKTKASILSRVRFRFVLSVMTFLLMIAIGFALFNDSPTVTPSTTPSVVELSQNDQQKIVEASYLTGNIIINSLGNTIEQLSFKPLASRFSDKADEFDHYFQMLKPLMDDQVTDYEIIELEDEAFDYRMTYIIDNQTYTFDLTMDQEEVQGILILKGLEFIVDGEIEVENENISIELNARLDSNYIKIEYESEVDSDESEKEYKVEEFINGVLKEREIKISQENDEVSLEMTEIYNETENTYELTKDSSGQQVIYYLEYEIDDVEGEGYITEEMVNGQILYRYHIEEGDIEEDYEYEDEDEYEEEDDEDQENPDDLDEEDEETSEELEDEEDQDDEPVTEELEDEDEE